MIFEGFLDYPSISKWVKIDPVKYVRILKFYIYQYVMGT